MGTPGGRRPRGRPAPCTARSTGRWSTRLGELGLLRGCSAATPTSHRATRRRCSCACSARASPRSTPRPRPRSRCRASAPTRSSSPGTTPPATAGCPASRAATSYRRSRCPSPTPAPTPARSSLEARPDGDGWTLHGTKTWISNAPDADVYSVFARTTPGARARGVTAFAVAGDSAGPHRRAARHGRPPRARHAPLRRRPGLARRRARRGRPGVRRSRCGRSTCSAPASARSRSGMAQAALDASLAWARSASCSAAG